MKVRNYDVISCGSSAVRNDWSSRYRRSSFINVWQQIKFLHVFRLSISICKIFQSLFDKTHFWYNLWNIFLLFSKRSTRSFFLNCTPFYKLELLNCLSASRKQSVLSHIPTHEPLSTFLMTMLLSPTGLVTASHSALEVLRYLKNFNRYFEDFLLQSTWKNFKIRVILRRLLSGHRRFPEMSFCMHTSTNFVKVLS